MLTKLLRNKLIKNKMKTNIYVSFAYKMILIMMEFSENKNYLALSKFEKMLKSNKVLFFDSDEFENIIIHYLDLGKISLAKRAIALSLNQHPDSTRLKIVKVELLLLEDKIKEAEKLLQHLEAIEPTYAEIYIQKAVIFSKKNKHPESIKELQIALKYTHDLADVHNLLGMEYLFIEDFTQAKKHFKICLDLNNEDYSALYNTIYCYEMNEEYTEVVNFLNDFINENPYNEFAWHQLGIFYNKIGQYNQAVKAFDYSILIDDLFSGAYFEKAKVLEKLKEYQLAIDNYHKTLELEDPSAVVFVQIANCYNKLNKHDKAVKYFLKAVDEDPLLDYAWLALTELLMQKEELEKARSYSKKAAEINKDNIEINNRYAEISMKLGFYEEAIETFENSISLGEKNPTVVLMLCDVLHVIGEYEIAIGYLELLKSNISENLAEIFFRLSGLFFLTKKNKEALFNLKMALKTDSSEITIFKMLFPKIYKSPEVTKLIEKFK